MIVRLIKISCAIALVTALVGCGGGDTTSPPPPPPSASAGIGAADAALDVLIQPDGKIVGGGTARNGASGGVGIVRVLP